jgi:hypothetical protein
MNGTQVRNLFYVKALKSGDQAMTTPGDLKVIKGTNVKLSGKEYIQLQYVNPDGQVIVSDFIVKDQAKVEAVAGKGTPLKKAVLSLVEDPIAGEDYIVDILVHNYQTIAENSVLAKYGAAHATTGMSKTELLFKLAKSFAMNFRRDAHLNDFFTFKLATAADGTGTEKEVTIHSKESEFGDSYIYLIIEEKKQTTWYRGTFPMQTVHFDVAPHTVISNGDEVQPFATEGESGLVKIEETATVIPNGYDMADLEYECHGEIGDQLREAGYPRNIRTKYAISDADVTKMFDAVEIYFYYIGRNTSVQKAEKQLTLAMEQGAQGAHTLAAAVASAITSAGVTVDTSDIQ